MNPPLIHPRRRNGKIARLPEPVRERINHMLLDGFRYRDIIKALSQPDSPPLPYPISDMNITNWRKGGYQDWRQLQERLELARERPHPFAEKAASLRQYLQTLRAQISPASAPPAPEPVRT